MTIYQTYYTSPLGQLRLVCSEEHVTAVLFCGEEGRHEQDQHHLLHLCATQLDEYFAGSRTSFALPLQQAGSTFQQTVWKLLMDIPFGKTISYQQLATRYGELKAIRAVASANGKNKLAIIVPCHRVIGSNHTLTGYAGGLWRKSWLLHHELKHGSGVQQMGLEFSCPRKNI
ncbi:MAG TPA: methylated-DNA--[protein]-cysteine S-methyltransferase [Flavisolibacter sp.]|nr:methylated-DNA--[protein]-cysteine S-methyltransferase [Flavisolibacter sp.]